MQSRVALFALVLTVCAGCQSPAPVAPAALPSTSIAYGPAEARAAALAWTTPPVPEGGPALRRSDGRHPELPSHIVASSQGTSGTHVGDAVERRTKVGALEGGPVELVATLQSSLQFGSTLENGGDAPTLWTNRFRLSLEKPTPYFGRIGLYGEYARYDYEFSGPNGFVGGTERPFDLVHRMNVGLNVFQPVHEAWALFFAGGVTWAAEDGADLADGFGWNVTAGVGHRLSETFDVGLGVLLSQSVGENDLYFIGGPQFDWHPNEHWSIALEGTTLEISYKPNPDWELTGGGGFTGHRFRLRKDGPAAGGSFSESGFPLWVQARFLGLADLDFAVRAGVDLDRSFALINRGGSTVRILDADAAPFVSIRAIWRL